MGKLEVNIIPVD